MPLTHQARPLRSITLETGCFVCASHLLNPDGYFRKAWGNKRSGDRFIEMFHRFIYRAHKGEIPEGWEVDHTCGVRACCNPDHLEAIDGVDHAVKTNRNRYAERKASAFKLWRECGCKGTELARLVGVTFSAACGWIREWKKE